MSEHRIAFMGTGEIAIPSLRWLIESGHRPVGLVTQPDRPAGRRRELKPPPLKELAVSAHIPVLQPEKIRAQAALEAVESLRPDLIIVMAYGQILPQRLIDMAPLGCVNLHASLLPKYRGAACIQAAIDAGDSESGVTLMHVVKELDAGDVILARRVKFAAAETGGSLHDRLADVAVGVLAEGLPLLLKGEAPRTPQVDLGGISHVPKLEREDGRIDWARDASEIERRLRAYDPWPGCWTTWREGDSDKRLKIFPATIGEGDTPGTGVLVVSEGGVRVGCGEGVIVLGEVQAEGARRMTAREWWNGNREVKRFI